MNEAINTKVVIERAGGLSKLARALGLHHTTVSGWRHVPASHCLAVNELTGIPLHDLRPDVYRADKSQVAA